MTQEIDLIFLKICSLLQGTTEYENRQSKDSITFVGWSNDHLEVELQEEAEGAVLWCYQVLFKEIETNVRRPHPTAQRKHVRTSHSCVSPTLYCRCVRKKNNFRHFLILDFGENYYA